MSIEPHHEVKHTSRSAQVLRAGLVPFVLATPHHAPAAVVAQIDEAMMIEVDTANGRDTRAIGQSTDRVTDSTGSHLRAPKIPAGQ